MGNTNYKARIILVGCGPHARRIYVPALRKIEHIELSLVIDLESQESIVRKALTESSKTELLLTKPFSGSIPVELALYLSNFVLEKGITGVIIATEPLVHKAYAEWALQNALSILMDKPFTARADSISKASSAEGILEDYLELLENYKKLQYQKETIFMVNSHRRFHQGFQFVKEQIREIGEKTNCPVTFIQAYHSDGQWRLPNEIVTQEYHPYCYGYGKASHSGYHIFDTIYQFYKAAEVPDKFADEMEFVSSFIQPNGFFTQFKEDDYKKIFGEQYNLVNKCNDEQLRHICSDFGEIDLSTIITLKKNDEAIANFSVNLIHNGFAGRTWLTPGEDLYKGNGRIKHESYHIQQGPFQSIQIHAYQSSDKHDVDNGQEDYLGGKNHFDIYVFRNPLVADSSKQPKVYMLSDIIDNTQMESESTITMELVKFKVVEEFADYLTGRKSKDTINSQIEDHIVPVQIMSGIYCSNLIRKGNSTNLAKSAFGLEKLFIMKTILIQPDVKGVDEFRKILSTNLVDFHIATSIDEVESHDIEIVIIWFYVPDFLPKLPNLKLILCCGSGVDQIIDSPNLPHNIPLIRLVDPFLRNHVSNYVVDQVFKYLFPEMKHIVQEEVLLKSLETTEYRKPTVGIMGLGLVGSSTAEKLINIGFEVCGWVNSSKPRFLKEVYIGIDELDDFAKKCEIIVCQLPLTKKTKGILNSHLFGLLPNGAFLINVGRGAHLVEPDLLFALDIGKLSGACLDVFEIEPLPLSHPFHANPKIKITPHIAGYVGPETQAPYAIQIIANYYENKNAMGLVDYLSHY